MDRLPLNALRAFETAARHGSFSAAAAELHLTHGAISHQVRALEDLLGNKLFERRGRGVRLTEAGQMLATTLSGAFLAIDQAMRLLRRAGPDSLTISVLTSFAARWLAPRLHHFHARHPDIALNMQTSRDLADLRRDGVDLAIRVGAGNYPGLRKELLMTDDIFPVAAPTLEPRPSRVEQLADHLLLRDSWDDWAIWCRVAGLDPRRLKFGTVIQDSSVLLDAAVRGQGIVIARSVLVADDLAAGRLVRLFDVDVPAVFKYWLVTLPERADEPAIARFRAWLHDEAAAFAAGAAS